LSQFQYQPTLMCSPTHKLCGSYIWSAYGSNILLFSRQRFFKVVCIGEVHKAEQNGKVKPKSGQQGQDYGWRRFWYSTLFKHCLSWKKKLANFVLTL
jgi:hypothetical protein